MDQLPRLGKRELVCLLLFTCNYVVSVWRGFLFLWVLGLGYVILLWHFLSLPYNYFESLEANNQIDKRRTMQTHEHTKLDATFTYNTYPFKCIILTYLQIYHPVHSFLICHLFQRLCIRNCCFAFISYLIALFRMKEY